MSSINHMVNRYPTPDAKEPLFNIKQIEDFFNSRELPQEVQLDSITHITDVPRFVRSHIEILRFSTHKPIYLPYYERLQKLAQLV